MDETLTETQEVEEQKQSGKKPVVHRSGRGGWRGGGRPRKVRPEKDPMSGSSLPALPPREGGLTKPSRLDEFWHSLTETQLAQTIVYINRHYPLCDAKVTNPDAPKYIEKIVGTCPWPKGEWKDWFFKTFGSGDYIVYFNEGTAQRIRTEVYGLRDYANYPPKIDWATLMVTDPKNRDFVKWARMNGFAEEISVLEKGSTPEVLARKEDEEMNAAIIEQNTNLTGQLVEMAREVASKPIVTSPRETLAERSALGMVEEAGKTANRMTEKAFDMLASRTNDNADPLSHTRTVIEMVKTLNTGTSENNTVIEILRDQVNSQREEMRELRAQLHTPSTSVQAQQTMTDKLQEMLTLKNLMRELNGGDDEKDEPLKPGTPKAMFMDMIAKNGPALIQATGGVLQSLFYGVSLLTRKNGDAPPPTPPPIQAPAPIQPTPQQKQEEDQLLFFFRMIEGSLKKHLNEWEVRDYPGADFADWLIDSQLDGRNSYDQMKAAGPDILIAHLQQYPPINAIITGIPEKFKTFVQQFLDRDAIRDKEAEETEETE